MMWPRLFLLSLSVVLFQLSSSSAESQCLNFGWRFYLGNLEDGAAPELDDSEWRIIDVPHDFQIEQPWANPETNEKGNNRMLRSRGYKKTGKGWYRLHLTPADSLRDRRLLLQFDGIMYAADVYLNGELIGGTDYGYVGFEIDVTDKLKVGKENVIAVMADTREPGNSRWYTGGGLFRSVRLVNTPKNLYFGRHPLYITTHDNRFLNATVELTNLTAQPALVNVQVIAPNGKVVYEDRREIVRHPMARTQEAKLIEEVELPDPCVWDVDSPQLYTLVARLIGQNGSVIDETSDHFGLRTVEIGPEFGLKLNGRKLLLKGYANHHTLGALGAAAYPRAIEKRILLMKQFGINHIRTSHNPYSREFIELCDKYGILVVNELYDKWTRQHSGGRVPFEKLWQRDIPEWVKRDRNSPSVVLWSLGNELQQDPNQPFNDFGVTMYRLMRTLVNRYDSTRLTTVAMHPRYRNVQTDSLPSDLAMITDVQSYNYRYMYFPGDGRRFPWMTFYQSEASVLAMGQNFFEMNLDKVIGLAYWGAIDYLGESEGWPAKGWAQGVFDIALEPKPKAYYMKSFFCPDIPVVHIAVVGKKGSSKMCDHWNHDEGSALLLIVYTNADEVELRLNGKSLGKKQNPVQDARVRNQIRWSNIDYQPGTLEAVAYKDGKEVARHKIETTGPAVKLQAQSDNADWNADGQDLQHVRIVALDAKGRHVQTADQKVTFSVSGPASIVGVINGNINSDEMTVGNVRNLYNGTCTVILRSQRQAGPVTLTATADGLNSESITMPVK